MHGALFAMMLGASLSPQEVLAQVDAASLPAGQEVRSFSIPSGPLGEALDRFARVAGVNLSYEAALVAGRDTKGLAGPHGIEAGLRTLLAGSGLQAVAREGGGYVLRRIAEVPTPQVPLSQEALPPVTVRASAQREAAPGPVPGFVPTRSGTATKTDTALSETPQSVSVVGRDELAMRAATSLAEAMRYTPGLQAEQYGDDPTGFGWFGLRGFSDTTSYLYVDGLRSPNVGYTARLNEPFDIERIEVLRGPASVLFGQGDAGGLVNATSKLPRAGAPRELELQVGNFGRRKLGLDVGGVLDDEQRITWRLVGTHQSLQDQEHYPGHGREATRRTYLAPSLSVRFSADTSLTLKAVFAEQQSPGSAYEYVGADLVRKGLLMGQPGFGHQDQSQREAGYRFEHRLTPAWTFRQNLRLSRSEVDMDALYGTAYSLPSPSGDIRQRTVTNLQSMDHTAVDTQLVGEWQGSDVRHTLVLGVDLMNSRFDSRRWRDIGPSLNVNLPARTQYGQPVARATTPWQSTLQKQEQLGLYVQDQIRTGPWVLTLGGRHDRAEDRSVDRLDDSGARVRDKVFSSRAGVNYVLASGWVPYASYTESFLPQIGADENGEAFKPTRGRQYEVGIKYQPAAGGMLFTAAVFDLTKTNIPTPDPADPAIQRLTGEITSRGIELEAKLALTRQISVMAQYTHNDVKVTRGDEVTQGRHPLNVPRQMASAWVDYAFGAVAPRLSAGLGVRYAGVRYGDDANTVRTPSYALLDGAVRYEAGPWRVALNINNLVDKDYVASYAYGLYRGTERHAILTVGYLF